MNDFAYVELLVNRMNKYIKTTSKINFNKTKVMTFNVSEHLKFNNKFTFYCEDVEMVKIYKKEKFIEIMKIDNISKISAIINLLENINAVWVACHPL